MKLRIPIFLLTIGSASGIVQLIAHEYTLTKLQNIMITIFFFSYIGGIVYITERTGLGNKRVNILIGLILIGLGIAFDLMTEKSGTIIK